MSGVLKFYNGTEDIIIGGNKASIDVSSTAPENPKLGDLWFDTSESEIEKAFDIDSIPLAGSEALITSGGVAAYAIHMIKLWENASPSSEFAAQTISLDLGEYDMLAVLISSLGLKFVKKEKQIDFNWINIWDTGVNLAKRICTSSSTGISFENCKLRNSISNSSVASETYNTILIPYAIYGIKGVN